MGCVVALGNVAASPAGAAESGGAADAGRTPSCEAGPPPASHATGRVVHTRSGGLEFVENRGQFRSSAAYSARVGNGLIWLSRRGVTFDVMGDLRHERLIFSQRFAGARATSRLVPGHERPGLRNFLIGGRARWHTGARAFGEVRYAGVWEGIDVRLSLRADRLEQEYIVRPGAEPRRIRIAYRGIERLRVASDGSLLISTAFGTLRENAPRIYQPVGGRRVNVEGRFRLLGPRSYSFALGRHRRDAPLIIDPTLAYADYVGGTGVLDEHASDVTVDTAGNAYLTGVTNSVDFPGADPARTHYTAHADAFVTKIDPAGTLAYTTYLGSDSRDEGTGIALDTAGNVFVTGETWANTEFATAGAAQPLNGGQGVAASLIHDAFVTKLDPSATKVVWSTFIGGAGDDRGNDVAVDAVGNAYVAGTTDSRHFPVVNAPQTLPGGPEDLATFSKFDDGFVTKVSADGSRFLYSTYIGGSGDDRGRGIALDAGGSAYVAGATASADFPRSSPLQSARRGASDAFVAKLPPEGGRLIYSTYLGGSGADGAYAVAVDRAQRAWVAGETRSWDFPIRHAAQPKPGEAGGDLAPPTPTDGFVAAIDARGTAIADATYLGGFGIDQIFDLTLDQHGDAYVTGRTNSGRGEEKRHRKPFPTKDAVQAARVGQDAFATKIDGQTGKLVFSTPLGGSREDVGLGIAADRSGSAYVAGQTLSPDLPGAHGRGRSGPQDGFIVKIAPGGSAVGGPAAPAYVFADIVGPTRMRSGRPARFTVVVGNSGASPAQRVPVWLDGIPADATWSTDIGIVPPPARNEHERALLSRVPVAVRHGETQLLPLFVPVIPAGTTAALTLTITVPTDRRITLRAWADPPLVAGTNGARAAADGGSSQRLREAARGCLKVVFTEAMEDLIKSAVPTKCIVEMELLLQQLGQDVVDKFIKQFEGEQPQLTITHGLIVQVLLSVSECIRDVTGELVLEAAILKEAADVMLTLIDEAKLEHLAGCEEAFGAAQGIPPGGGEPGAAPGASWSVDNGSSLDPNDKAASPGHGPRHYVSGREPLRYSIAFENLATAALPAQQVVITDRLAPGLDLNSIRFGPVTVGRQRAGPTTGVPALSTQIDLRPSQNLRVIVEGSVDRARRVVTWRFRTVDADTGGEPDILAGFLPPNTQPPEGQGSVTLFVAPRRGLKNGTAIRNQASIAFDTNPAITTRVRVNRIDAAEPHSRVSTATRRGGRRLRLSWHHRDSGSGVGRIAVFASEDAKPFRRVRVTARARRGAFPTKRGRHYVFYTVAQDRAGNAETTPRLGDLLAPAPRARRRGSAVVIRVRFYVQRAGTLTVSARGRRGRAARLLPGSRLGTTALRRAGRRLTTSVRAPGAITLRLRVPRDALARGQNVAVVRPRAGDGLQIPFNLG